MALENISIPIALGAGILSFFSPCILPLIPAYIMYMTGSTLENEVSQRKFKALSRTFGFVIGFTIVFIIMGASASFIDKVFIRNKLLFTKISGIIIIAFGLNLMGIFKLNFLNRTKKASAPKIVTSWFTSILMGMAFAAGWTPCFGPILASILIYASTSNTLSQGIFLLFVYSIGMAIPFILTAIFINMFNRFLEKTEKVMMYLPKISGLIMVIFGLLVFFNKVIDISRLLQ